MTKYFIIAALVILSVVVLTACTTRPVVLGEKKTYDITSDIHSLEVEINAAEFTIVEGDKFSAESNLKNLSVTEENGVLRIVDKTKISGNYANATLKLCIPKNTTFEKADIKTGASKLNADYFSANTLKLKTGAGRVAFDYLEVLTDISVKGGAGEIVVKDGSLNNLALDLGVGKLELTSKLLGNSNLKFGVGQSDITLLGGKDDYKFNVENGVGNITIDGASSAFYANSGNGENKVNIKGGVGTTNISFQ